MPLPERNWEINPRVEPQSVAVSVIAIVAVAFFLRYAQELFVPVVISILIAYALNPFVVLLERCRIHRGIAAALVVIALFGAITFAAYGLRQQFGAVLDNVPAAVAKVRKEIEQYRQSRVNATAIGKIQQAANEIEKTAAEATGTPQSNAPGTVRLEQPAFRVTDFIRTGSVSVVAFVSDAVVVFFLVFFLLLSEDLFRRKVFQLAGSGWSRKRLTLETLNEINAQIERFLLIQALMGIAVAGCMTVGLSMLGLHQPAFWGGVAGVLYSIPYVGPIIVGIALMLAAFVQFDSFVAALEIASVPLVVFSLEGFLVKPAIMGKAARVNGLAMFLGLLFWGWVWGLVGIVVAVPIMMVIKTVCDRIEGLHAVGALLDEN
jgi:predicted PurR-regulated permease PerM